MGQYAVKGVILAVLALCSEIIRARKLVNTLDFIKQRRIFVVEFFYFVFIISMYKLFSIPLIITHYLTYLSTNLITFY